MELNQKPWVTGNFSKIDVLAKEFLKPEKNFICFLSMRHYTLLLIIACF
jgi:hypothetical protein